jgi:cytohesin
MRVKLVKLLSLIFMLMASFSFSNPTLIGLCLLAAGAFACSKTFRPFGMERSSNGSSFPAPKTTQWEAAMEAAFAPQCLPAATWEDALKSIGLKLKQAASKNKLRPELELHHAVWLSDKKLLKEQCKKNGHYAAYVVGNEKVTPLHLAVYRGMDDCIQLLLKPKYTLSLGMEPSGIQPLHIAASQDNASVLIRLLQEGASVKAIDATGRTALHWAAAKGSTVCTYELLQAGSSPTQSDDCNDTPLCLALRYGHASVVKQLIQAGGIVDCLYCMNGSSDYIARWSLVNGYDYCLEALVKKETVVLDGQKKDAWGITLWELALLKKRRIGFQYLLRSPEDLNCCDAQGNTLLHRALQEGFISSLSLPSDKLPDTLDVPNHTNTNTNTIAIPRHRLAIHKNTEANPLFLTTLVNEKNQRGATMLHIAVLIRNVKEIRALLDSGVDINAQDKDGNTPLHWASEEGYIEVIDVLLASGAKLNAKNKHGDTPMHFAAFRGNTKAIDTLLAAGAELNVKDEYGDTPLHFAAFHGNLKTIEMLLQVPGIDVHTTDKYGNTILHATLEIGHIAAVRTLLIQAPNIDVNAKNQFGRTALHKAAEEGYAEAIDVLLTAGAELNMKDESGQTPLHVAATNGHVEVIYELLQNSNNCLNTKDKHGQTPLHKAALCGRTEAINALLTAGAKLNAKDEDGQTSLHKAAFCGRIEAIHELLMADAELNVKDKDGQTPLDVAQKRGHSQAESLLKEAIGFMGCTLI